MHERGIGVSELGKLSVSVNSSDVAVHPSAVQEVHSAKKQFDWKLIKDQGIDGFVAEAERRGLLGLTSEEVKKKDKSFHPSFGRWIDGQPEELKKNIGKEFMERKKNLVGSRSEIKGLMVS